MTRCLVVVNPAAGGGRTGRLWPRFRAELHRLGLAFEWAASTRRGHAIDLARQGATAGADLVVAVGGDGTLNEVVNGAVGAPGAPGPVVGAILTGRGRDAIRNFGLAADPRLAARRLVDGEDVRLDLVCAAWPDGARRWAVGAAGAGFDAAVAARTATGGGRGTLPYAAAVLRTLYGHVSVDAQVEADGERVWSGPLSTVICANAVHVGGGMKIAPAADPADGRLDLVIVGDVGRVEMIRWLPSLYRGRHLANPKVVTRTAERVTVHAARPLPVQVDGEPAPDGPVSFTVSPGALRLRR